MLNSLKLLYIEDDEDIQIIYTEYLKEFVTTIYHAQDGEAGFDLYLSQKPDIILLDINMPKLDGLSLAKKIRMIDKKVKIIITTSYSDQCRLLQAIELSLIKYILKPMDPTEFKEAIMKAIYEIESERNIAFQQIFLLDKEIFWDTREFKLIEKDEEVKLTKNERKLLTLLSTDKNRVYTFFEIFEYLSYDNFYKEYDANQIRALVKLVRKKIPKNSILNIYGEGYRFNPLNR